MTESVDISGAAFLPYGRQVIDDDDVAAVVEVLRSDRLTTGPAVDAFEAAFRARTDGAEAVAVSSGTAALHIAALALGLGSGDAVVVPSMTFVATANAVRFTGADVIFADVDPDTGLMEASHLEAALARADDAKVKAVFPVHLAGQAPDMAALTATARANGLKIVEDACHSVGGAYRDRNGATTPIGGCAHSDMTVFSFHPVKTIAMGEGGLVSCTDDRLADTLKRLRNHGLERRARHLSDPAAAAQPWYYEIAELGFNYRASDIHCALGMSQLKKLDVFVAERGRLASLYDDALASLAPRVRPIARRESCVPAWHLYPVLIDFDGLDGGRARMMKDLKDRGIETQVHYIPVHTQPYYRALYGALDLPGANAYYARCLSLPLFVGLTGSDVERVCDAMGDILGH